MVALGPLLTLAAASSCLGTIISGHLRPCLSDLTFVAFGGVLFVIGIIVAVIGVIVPDPYPSTSPRVGPVLSPQQPNVTCKKCGSVYSSGLFFCPSCGQRPS